MTSARPGATVRDVQRIRDIWQSDRGRLVHYLVAATLGVFVIAEFATLEDRIGDPVDHEDPESAGHEIVDEAPPVALPGVTKLSLHVAHGSPLP